ncbi:MAG TPA: MFS transporter [Cytophagales bacterium]|nr:MFS transporter [Cytophagales bacterium]
MEKNNKKIINAWCTYDWANSVYSLVITSTIFPIYYNAVTSTPATDDKDYVNFFGFEIVNTVLYSYSLSFSFLIIALISPLLSGIADYSHRKKDFLKFFAWMGAIACMGLYFFDKETLEFGIFCMILGSMGYAGSLIFYDAYLPEIATPDKYDIVSAKGYSMGYIGGVILMVINLVMIQMPTFFGFPENSTEPVKLSFLMVGVWWIVFSILSFRNLPSGVSAKDREENILKKGYLEIIKVLKSLKGLSILKLFLISFFFYNMGVQTVMYLAATFGEKELHLPAGQLMATILIIQLVGILGSYTFAFLSKKKGNKFSLLIMLLIWIAVCIGAYFILNAQHFFFLAFIVGLVMGGIQSLSRATYSKLIPENTIDTASYFSFYNVTFYLSVVCGTFAYGLIEQITGSMRNSTFVLAVFFAIGLGFLLLVKIPLHKGYKKKVALGALEVIE